jgi:hypothetical protein
MRRLRQERGFTVVAAMLVLLVGLLFATAAVGRAISTESSVRRDGSSKRAVQAARAGMERTAYRLSALAAPLMRARGAGVCPAAADGSPKITPTTSVQVGAIAPVNGRCPVPFSDEVGAGELVDTYVSVDQEGKAMVDKRDIVAIGSVAGDVPRRVKTDLKITDISQILRDFTVFSDQDLTIQNQADVGTSEVHDNIGSNGNIYVTQPNAVVWGSATAGPNGTVDAKGIIKGGWARATEPLELPPVDLAAIRLKNDNSAICGTGCTSTPPAFNPAGGTYKGNVFLVCSVSLVANDVAFEATDPATPVRIYVEEPSRCPGKPSISVDIGKQPAITVTSSTYKSLQIYVAGDPNYATTVNLANNYVGGVPITLYAPNSTVTADNHGAVVGGIVAKSITLSNNTVVKQPSTGSEPLFLGEPPKIVRGDFLECTPRPDAGTNLTEGC